LADARTKDLTALSQPNRDISPAIDAIVLKSIAKNPGEPGRAWLPQNRVIPS
jgi:hypothetical protein